ncbi:MAG TPA: hypothetical protein PKO05_00990, partial [Thermoanaerobaculia bacterium]|nr:hypothetical protein [Thermoanaerobaculia bacterium]
MSRPLTAALLLALLLGASPLAAGVVEVRIKLPVRAKIDLAGRRTVAIAPFITVGREGAGRQSESSVDVQQEFERHLTKLLRRETDLKLVESGRVDYPTYELDLLSRNRDFWRALGERLQTDLILTGSLDFDVQDKSGYRTEEYVSPYDGRTYYRQVLVEQTGFEYDIVFQVYDGRTGELLFHDNFKDFRQIEGEKADPLLGMFENLRALEDRIAGVFTQKQVEASRLLLTD